MVVVRKGWCKGSVGMGEGEGVGWPDLSASSFSHGMSAYRTRFEKETGIEMRQYQPTPPPRKSTSA